jgi:hypothetical protein
VKIILVFCALALSFVTLGSTAFAAHERGHERGIEWLDKNRDKDGCVPLFELNDFPGQPKSCPKEFSPDIRPLVVATLDHAKSDRMTKANKKAVCCFTWKTP